MLVAPNMVGHRMQFSKELGTRTLGIVREALCFYLICLTIAVTYKPHICSTSCIVLTLGNGGKGRQLNEAYEHIGLASIRMSFTE